MITNADRARGWYFAAVIAYTYPDAVSDAVEAAALEGFLDAFAAAAAAAAHPLTYDDLADAYSIGYDGARQAAQARYSTPAARLQTAT